VITVNYPPLEFVHNRKTAGTSIRQWLLEHTDCESLEEWHELPEAEAGIPRFTVVRHPYDRLVSSFLWDRYVNDEYAKGNILVKPEKRVPRAWLKNIQEYTYWCFINTNEPSQVDYARGCRWILRYENLDDDFEAIRQYLGVKAPLPHLKKQETYVRDDYLTAGDKTWIYQNFQHEFREFNYDTEITIRDVQF